MEIKQVQSRVKAMLEERSSLGPDQLSFAGPDKFWVERASYYDYMVDLPAQHFSKLRVHTHAVAGDHWSDYIGSKTLLAPRLWQQYSAYADLIPAEYRICEPEGGIGFRYENGEIISVNTVRFQKIISSLYTNDVLKRLRAKSGRTLVLEIGAGYGGLAYHLSKCIGDVTYVIVDLPETLLFSASYLSLQEPSKKLWLYQPEQFTQDAPLPPDLEAYDYIFLPNYRLSWLRDLRFDLVVNTVSLPEMSQEQVEVYLDFVRDTCRGVFYSDNSDWRGTNDDLVNYFYGANTDWRGTSDDRVNYFELLQTRFLVTTLSLDKGRILGRRDKLRKALSRLGSTFRLWEKPLEKSGPRSTFRECLCQPMPRASELG